MSDEKAATHRVEVYDSGGMVVIDTDDQRFIFEPASAVEFANAMLRCASACGVEIRIETDAPKRHITELQRATLIARTVHMLRSLQGKKPEYTAMQIVDTILGAIS